MRKKPNSSSSIASKKGNDSNGEGHPVGVLSGKGSAKKKNATSKVIYPPVTETTAYEQLNGLMDNRELLRVLTEVKNGNFSVRMPFDHVGLSGKVCDTVNEIISLNERMIQEFTKAGQ
ncbi:MAG: hypothetical protein M3Y60_13570, partial [Bacteroidota bacterium]|nr:hypothetical protein [Bacteroidota bacterium]